MNRNDVLRLNEEAAKARRLAREFCTHHDSFSKKKEKKDFQFCKERLKQDDLDRRRLHRVLGSPLCPKTWPSDSVFEDMVNLPDSFCYNSKQLKAYKKISRTRNSEENVNFRVPSTQNLIKPTKRRLTGLSHWQLHHLLSKPHAQKRNSNEKIRRQNLFKKKQNLKATWAHSDNDNSYLKTSNLTHRKQKSKQIKRIFKKKKQLAERIMDPNYFFSDKEYSRNYHCKSIFHSTTPRGIRVAKQ